MTNRRDPTARLVCWALHIGHWSFFRHSAFDIRHCAAGLAILLLVSVAPSLAAEADNEFTFAARLLERGEHKLAHEAFEQFIKQFPGDGRVGDAHYYLAVLARRRGDLAAAEEHLHKVHLPRHVTDAALRILRGQVKLERGQAAAALAELEQVKGESLPDASTRATWHYLLGAAYRASGNPSAAAERFAAAAEGDPALRPAALVELGKARAELNEPAAIESLVQAISASPALPPATAAEARSLAADLAYRLKRYEQSADLYRQIVQQHQASPEFGPAVVGVLRSLFAAGQYQQVLSQYEATKSLIPAGQMPEAAYLVGTSHVQLQQYAQASEEFLRFYRLTGGDHRLAGEVAYHYALCFYHTDLDGFEKWVASFEKDLPRMSRGDELQYLRAQAAIRREKPAEAVRHLTPLVERSDSNFTDKALLQRAGLLEVLGRSRDAAADYALYAQRFGGQAGAAEAARRAIDLAFRSGDFAKVVELAGPWLERKDTTAEQAAEVRLKLALSLLKLDRNHESLQALSALLESKPQPPIVAQAQYWRGVLLAAASPGDSLAVESLRQAADGPLPQEQKVAAIALIAQQHVRAGREKEAIEAYEQLRALRPPEQFDPAVALWVGRGLAAAGRDEAALQWLMPLGTRQAVPEAVRAEALFHAAEALRRLQRHEPAIELYRQVVALSRGYEDRGRLGLAHALRAAGKTEEALGEYDGLISAAASEVAAESLLQSALLRLQSPQSTRSRDEARKRLNRIVILYDVPQLSFLVGQALVTLGTMDLQDDDKASARKQFEAIVRQQPRSAWHEAAQAELAILDGNLGAAATLLRKIYHHEGGHPAIKAHAQQRLQEIGERP